MHRPLSGLNWHNIARELLAGVTLLAISVPLNIGYAQIAGLPATAGLYALVIPTIVYALTVSSRQVVASPDAAAAALVFSSLMGLQVGGENFAAMAAAQAILSGLMLWAASALKLGFLANFLSKPILVGFVGGLALEILLSQVAKMLGIKLEPGGEFFENLVALCASLGSVNPWSLGMSAVALAILLVGKRWASVVPWALVVLVLTTLGTALWGLEARGVAVLGEVTSGPPVLEIPMLELASWLALIPSALALTLITTAEGLLVSRSYAEKNHYTTSPNRDLFAFGAANVAAGFSGSFAVGSSTSRTAAMDQLRSRTQLPSLVLAAGTLLLLLFGTALLAQIPSPAIGAVVAVAVFGLLGIAEFRVLWAQSKFEFGIGATCFAAVLVLGPLSGLFLAFVLSLVNLARRAAAPPVDILIASADPKDSLLSSASSVQETAPGIVVVRFAAPLFFANGNVLATRLNDIASELGGRLRTIVLDMEAVTDVDVTGAEALRGAINTLGENGVALAYTRVRPELRDLLAQFELTEGVTQFATNRAALAALASATDGLINNQ